MNKIEEIKKASEEELTEVRGITLQNAESIKEYFASQTPH